MDEKKVKLRRLAAQNRHPMTKALKFYTNLCVSPTEKMATFFSKTTENNKPGLRGTYGDKNFLNHDPKTQYSVSIFDTWPEFWIIFAMPQNLCVSILQHVVTFGSKSS